MYYLGVDLGGTNIAAGLVDKDYKLVHKCSIPTQVEKGVDAIINNIALAINKVVDGYNITMDDVISIGIGSPGAVNPDTGVVDFAANLGFKHTPLAQMVSKLIPGKDIFIENDANVAALAEVRAGAAKGVKDSITITLGTGVGGGMIINGKIYSGFNHAGAEFGHIVLEEGGRRCSCGRNGCWEAYASVTGLIKTTKEEMLKDSTSIMWDMVSHNLDNVTGLTAFDAMRAGDKLGTYVVYKYIRYVASGLVSVMNVLQPEVLCIGGGISKEGDTLIKPIREVMKNELFARFSDIQTQIRVAALGNDAGIIGAALLNVD
jgi:ROK family protein